MNLSDWGRNGGFRLTTDEQKIFPNGKNAVREFSAIGKIGTQRRKDYE